MKVDGSYRSLVQGVSQQPGELRLPGQLEESVNMIPDPIRGQTRRWGSRFLSERLLPGVLTTAEASLNADLDNYATYEYNNNGKDYVVHYRKAARPVGSTLPVLLVFNRTDNVWLAPTRPAVDAQMDLLESGGISAITSVGKYLFYAGNLTTASVASTPLWLDVTNVGKAVAWVRGGAYARTYSLTVTNTSNVQTTVTYKTPTSSYGGTLDTSDIPLYIADPAGGTESTSEGLAFTSEGTLARAKLAYDTFSPTSLVVKEGNGTAWTNVHPAAPAPATKQYSYDSAAPTAGVLIRTDAIVSLTATYTHTKALPNPVYNKQVQDRVNAYNSEVTEWIGTAAAAIAPEAIAQQLVDKLVLAGVTATREGSTVCMTGIKEVSADDGGDDTLLRGVAQELTSIDLLSSVHHAGKVVRIKAASSADAFYMRAVPKTAGTTGFTEVTWVEGAESARTISGGLFYGLVDGTQFSYASTPALLDTVKVGGGTYAAPAWVASSVGDGDTNPTPFFIGRKISYLDVFQDRLVIGAGGTLRFSRVGEYLTVFRSTTLTIPADDTLELLSQGSEDDEMRYGVLYDRELVVFGKKRQYAVSGRAPLTPVGANMPVMSNHVGASESGPLAVGGVIYYAKQGTRAAALYQIQPGRTSESPESFPVSSQLDDYLAGRAIEITSVAKPAMVLMRVTGKPNDLKTFTYLDAPDGGRLQEAWGTWNFAAALGKIIGVAATEEGVLVSFLRVANGGVYTVADLVPVESGRSPEPYLDSWRPWASVSAGSGSLRTNSTVAYVAYAEPSVRRYIGDSVADATALIAEFPTETASLRAGYLQTSYFDMTNPFVLDSKDKPITTGRLTVTKFLVKYDESSGFDAFIDYQGTVSPAPFNGLVFGDVNAVIGVTPVTEGQQSITVGRDSLEFKLRIQARDWAPLTVSFIQWIGQFFNRKRRT